MANKTWQQISYNQQVDFNDIQSGWCLIEKESPHTGASITVKDTSGREYPDAHYYLNLKTFYDQSGMNIEDPMKWKYSH